jgi:hypothetical protein
MRSFLVSAALFVACFLPSCSSISVTDDYDNTVDFAKLRTWSWLAGAESGSGAVVTLAESRIRAALENEMAERGYPHAPSGGSFLVSSHAVLEQRIEAGPEPYGYGWRSGYMGSNVMVYDEGTLIVDFIDPKSKNMIWRGTASAVVDESDTGSGLY